MPNRDWAAIRRAWEARGPQSVEALARTFHMKADTLRYHATRERWANPVRRYRQVGGRLPTGTVRARGHDCGALYDATLTKDGASPHCAASLATREELQHA